MRTIVGCLFVVVVASRGWPSVLCQQRSGAVFVRTACKKKEMPFDPIALGLQGP